MSYLPLFLLAAVIFGLVLFVMKPTDLNKAIDDYATCTALHESAGEHEECKAYALKNN